MKKLPEEIAGAGKSGGSAAPYMPKEAPNTLQSTSVYRVLDLIGEGEIEGLSDGLKSIFINEVPLMNPDGVLNFKGISIDGRAGVPGQTPVAGFPDGSPTYVPVNRNFTKILGGPDALLGPYQTSIMGETNLDFFQIIVSIDALWRQETNGDTNGESVTFYYEIQANDTLATTSGNHSITGKCMSAYQRSLRLPAPVSHTGDYTLKLQRITDDFPSVVPAGTVRKHGSLSIVGYTLIRERQLEYPDCAYVLGVADARLFGSNVPKRAYKIKGLKISVPTGYTPPVKDPATGLWAEALYPAIWSGSMTPLVYTSNPAWCLYDIITSERYGAGIPDVSGRLKTALYPIAKYCDELIDDGFGGKEPRFTLNYVINQQTDAYALINALVSVFRGMCWWGPGSVLASQDAPNALTSSIPQVLATPANVINGEFSYEGSAAKARHSIAMVTWNDPEDHGRPTIEYVEDREALLRFGPRTTELVGVGCTSRGQAHRVGKWLLDSEANETEVVKYKAGLDHTFVAPGMIVAVADPFYQSPAKPSVGSSREFTDLNRMAGRIVSATTEHIEIDAPVTLTSGVSTYTLSFMTSTAAETSCPKIIDRPVNLSLTGADTPVTTIRLAVNLLADEVPETGAVWLISAHNQDIHQTARLFRVLSITEEDGAYVVMALQHDPTKYARVENNLNLLPPVWDTIQPSPTLAPPGEVKVTLSTRFINNQLQNTLTFSWEPSPDGRTDTYGVEWRVSTSSVNLDGTWAKKSLDGPAYVEIGNLSLGFYEFRVRSESGLGTTSIWKTADFQLDSDTLPAVSNLHLVNNEGLGRETFFTGRDIKIAWEDGAVTGDNIAITEYVYLIEVNGAFLYETSRLDFTYTLFMNSSDNGGQPQRTISFSVYKKKRDGQISDTSAYLEVQNVPPSMAGYAPILTAGFKSVNINWSNWSTDDTDLVGFKVLCDTANPPLVVRDVVGPTHTGWSVRELDALQIYFVQIVPIDSFGEGIPSVVPSECAPTILAGTDVNIELRDSVLVTDSLDSTQDALLPLHDRDRFGTTTTYSGAGTKWIQYAFNIENYIDQVIVYAGSSGLKFYVSYSVDGDNWAYLAGNASHGLTVERELTPVASDVIAEANYWLTDGEIAQAVFPQRITAKFCRLHVLGDQTAALSEVMFVREVIAEQIVADNLSAISANLGTVVTGEIISSNYSPGVAGMYVNVNSGIAEFNDMMFSFHSPVSLAAAQAALNVEDGATAGAPEGTYVGATLAEALEATANETAAGTLKYRTPGAPDAVPTPTGITITTNSNATISLRVDWGPYADGDRPADFLMLFWARGSAAPTLNDSCVAFNVNKSAGSYFIFDGVNPADTWSVGIAAARRTENGVEIGQIICPTMNPDWLGVSGGTPNFTGNIAGTSAATLLTNISTAATTANWSGISGAGKPADYATVGATWGNNLGGIPIRFAEAPSSAGLYVTSSYMGFWSTAWKVYIANNGQFYFGGQDSNNFFAYNGTNLLFTGKFQSANGYRYMDLNQSGTNYFLRMRGDDGGDLFWVKGDGSGYIKNRWLSAYDTQTFTSSGTFVVPPGVTRIMVDISGGGGGGASGASYGYDVLIGGSGGGGAGAGSFIGYIIQGLTPGQAIAVTVGGAGAGGAAQQGYYLAGVHGSNGGSSSFGSYITLVGGGGGRAWTWDTSTGVYLTSMGSGGVGPQLGGNPYGGGGREPVQCPDQNEDGSPGQGTILKSGGLGGNWCCYASGAGGGGASLFSVGGVGGWCAGPSNAGNGGTGGTGAGGGGGGSCYAYYRSGAGGSGGAGKVVIYW